MIYYSALFVIPSEMQVNALKCLILLNLLLSLIVRLF